MAVTDKDYVIYKLRTYVPDSHVSEHTAAPYQGSNNTSSRSYLPYSKYNSGRIV